MRNSNNSTGLRFGIRLAIGNEQSKKARSLMLKLCEIDPACVIANGIIDEFDESELGFLGSVVPQLLATIGTAATVGSYEKTLREKLTALPKGKTKPVKTFKTVVPVPDRLAKKRLDDVPLSVRTLAVLEKMNVQTVGDLVALPASAVASLSLGVVNEVRSMLQTVGVVFVIR